MERQRIDEQEFWELYADSQPHLVRFARRLCSDDMLAEDAVAEAFVSVLKTIRKPGDSGPTRETFISYLRVCVRHEVARLARRMGVEETNADIEAQLEHQQLAEHSDDRLDDVDVWDGDVAQRAFGSLSERDQALLALTEIKKQPLAEVAQSQGMTAQAVAAATYRARDALRTNYLIEAASAEPACPNMRVDFLAAFARGKAPSVRRRKIEAHLDECDRCPGRLRRMLSYRVPVAVVVLLTSAGGVLGSGSGSTPASAVEESELAREAAALRAAARGKAAGAVSGGALLLVLAGLAAWVLLGQGSWDAGQRASDSGSPATGSSTAADEEAPINKDADDSGVSDSLREGSDGESDGGPNDGSDAGSNSGSDGDRADDIGDDEQKKQDEKKKEDEKDLPPGVRSADWLTPPENYVAGGRDAKLLLAVEFDPTTKPSDYVVEVSLPSGVRVTRASAGCVVETEVVRCAPTSEMLSLRLFSFQFFTDLSEDAPLPSATVVVK